MRNLNLIFSVLLTGFGSIGLIRQLREFARAWSSRRWPTGEAEIVTSAVHERRGSRGRTVFEPTVAFSYKFREHEYRGHRLMFGDVATDRPDAEKAVARFKPGTRWHVSICASRPELSVLHPGLNRRVWFAFVFFLAYTSFAVSFLVDALQRP